MKHQSGTSLVELMCAIAILTVTAVSVAFAGSGHGRVVTVAFQETVALSAAQSHLEKLRAQPLTLSEGTTPIELPPRKHRQLPDAKAERTVQSIGPDLWEVEVKVRWRQLTGSRYEEVLLTTWMVER